MEILKVYYTKQCMRSLDFLSKRQNRVGKEAQTFGKKTLQNVFVSGFQ
jgi:hypothetical protein